MNPYILRLADDFRALRGPLANGALAVAAGLLISGCGSDADNPAASKAGPAATAALGAGGVSGAVPIVLAPASGPCAASGTAALQSPRLNSQIDCAP